MTIWRKSLLVQLVGSFLLLALVIVALVGYAAFAQAKAALKQAVFEQLETLVELKEDELNRWLFDQHQTLRAVAQLPAIAIPSATLLNREAGEAAHQQAQQALAAATAALIGPQPGWKELFLLSPSSRVLVSSDPKQRGQYQPLTQASTMTATGRTAAANVYPAPDTQRPRITLAVPVTAASEAAPAFWAVHLDLQRLDEIVGRRGSSDLSSDIYLVGNLGGGLARRYQFVRASQFGDAEFAAGITSPGIEAAMQGQDGRGLYRNYRGVPVVGVYNFLPQQDVALLAEEPQAIAFAPAQRLALSSLAIGGGLAWVLAIATVSLGRQIVGPVKAIAQAARLVSDRLHARRVEDLPQVPVLARNELGILAQAFNQMIGELQLSYAKLAESNHRLEARVAERTQALAENNERLALTLHNLQRAQAQLVQTEKMASLGQLVAGVAHEINNPVGFIIGNLEHLRSYSEALLTFATAYAADPSSPRLVPMAADLELDFVREDLPEVIASIETGATRISTIVNSLRVFSRLDEAEGKAVDLQAGLESTLLILQHQLGPTPTRGAIAVQKQYETLPRVECYAGQLNQVWLNLLTNALDALESAVAVGQTTSPCLTLRTQVTIPGWVSVSIADNGIGMTAEVRDRIFDPFFTTKPVGKGTGLGLSMSYAIIVDRHHGRLSCRSTPGQGSEFIVEIPTQLRQPA